MKFLNIFKHLWLVIKHRHRVFINCCKCVIVWRGLVHDLSKFSPTEFFESVKYYQGNRSPIGVCRRTTGVSLAWLHHKGRNKHHFEYWIDYTMPGTSDKLLVGMKMPVRYVVEMFMDRIAACKVYQKENYTDASAWAYHQRSKRVQEVMHPESLALIDKLLKMLAEEGEAKTFAYTRRIVMQDKKNRLKNSFRLLKELF